MRRIVLVRTQTGGLAGRGHCGEYIAAAWPGQRLACVNGHSPSVRFCSRSVLLNQPELISTGTILSLPTAVVSRATSKPKLVCVASPFCRCKSVLGSSRMESRNLFECHEVANGPASRWQSLFRSHNHSLGA